MPDYEFANLGEAFVFLENNPLEHALARELAIHVGKNYLYENFQRVAEFIVPHLSKYLDDIELQNYVAFICWVTGDSETSGKCAGRVIALNPLVDAGYLRLGLNYLTQNRYLDAFLALSAGENHCQNTDTIKSWNRLASVLMTGKEVVDFTCDGVDYHFRLSCFSTQAMESDATHANGMLTELEELRFLKGYLKEGLAIVECGTLTGNHAVYFLKNLSPSIYYGIDADPASCRETRVNLDLNRQSHKTTKIRIKEAAVCDFDGEIEMNGKPVAALALSSTITEPVDFIKIDVDGMELKVVEGARAILMNQRPRLMIEVKKSNRAAFDELMTDLNYHTVKIFDRGAYENIVLEPLASE